VSDWIDGSTCAIAWSTTGSRAPATHIDGAARAGPSDCDQPDGWVKKTEIARIGGDNLLPRTARADHHVGIDDVSCSAGGEQPADIGRVHPAEIDNVTTPTVYQA
jgi:hypothetical protein